VTFPPPNRSQSASWIDIAPGDTQGFTIALNKKDTDFLKNGSLVVVARFFDPAKKVDAIPDIKILIVRAPLHFKDAP
jgi:hypothetical protein